MSLQTDALIAEARRYVGVVEEPKLSNRGLCIDYWIHECGLDPKGGYPWCAAFIGQVGRQALGHAWPVPRTASCTAIAAWAEQAQRLVPAPQPGNLFLLWEASLVPARYGHVGIVTEVGAQDFDTIEGNTNPGGSRDGFGVFVRRRPLGGRTRFVRWEGA
jgi:hypothetical protein